MTGLPTILLAEDDDNDAALLQMAFKRASISNPVKIVSDGKQVLSYLKGAGSFANRDENPWPALMLLDLKMPLLDGFGVLAWWQKQSRASDLPIIVMTNSTSDSDIHRAIALGAASYFIKPANMQYFIHVAHQLRERWLTPAESRSWADPLPEELTHARPPSLST